jgi:hypothetical protein
MNPKTSVAGTASGPASMLDRLAPSPRRMCLELAITPRWVARRVRNNTFAIEPDSGSPRLPSDLRGSDTQRGVNARIVEVALEFTELPLDVEQPPEEHVIEELATDRADEPVDELMRHRCVRRGLHFVHVEYDQVGTPAVTLRSPSHKARASLQCGSIAGVSSAQ